MKVKRNITVNVKFSQEEKAELEKIAIDIGSDFAAWLRQAALEQRKIILGKRWRPIQHNVQQTIAVPKSDNPSANIRSSADLENGSKPKAHTSKKIECPLCYDEFTQVTETQKFCSTNCEDQFNNETKRCSQCELQWLGESSICPECEYLNGLKKSNTK